MKRQATKYHFDGLAALVLFGIFSVCVMSVLLTGANAYKRLVKRDEMAYDRRICMQYVATRVWQAEGPGQVQVEAFGDGNALVLMDDTGYVTRVYYYKGYIMELYTAADNILSPEAGERVIEVKGMEFSLEKEMLTVTVIDMHGEENTIRFSLRSGGEAST